MPRGWAAVVRLSAFVRKELVDILRQPRLLLALVVGPFLILFAFGAGLLERDPPMATAFVAPEQDELAQEVVRFARAQEGRLDVRSVGTDEAEALDDLRAGRLDMVVVFPEEAAETVRSDDHAPVVAYHTLVDPIEIRAMELFLRTAVDEINQQVLRSVVTSGQKDAQAAEPRIREARERAALLRAALEADDEAAAGRHEAELRREVAILAAVLGPSIGLAGGVEGSDDGLGPAIRAFLEGDEEEGMERSAQQAAELESELISLEEALVEFQSLSPEVIVSPFEAAAEQVGSGAITLADFYAPAVIVVLLQHLVVTFIGLSIVRDEELGTNELFRTAPIQPVEVLAGKAVAFVLIGGAVAAGLLGLLVVGLGTPMLGSPWTVAVIVFALLASSVALGCVVALVARTDSQAVQYAMMVLLATIFFSGFLLDLDRFVEPLRGAAYLLPATHGIDLLRDAMLRGRLGAPVLVMALAAMAVVLFAIAAFQLGRRLRRSS